MERGPSFVMKVVELECEMIKVGREFTKSWLRAVGESFQGSISQLSISWKLINN